MSYSAAQLERARNILWARGDVVQLKLHATQLEMLKGFEASPARKYVINCSRRIGKSYFLCALSDRKARQKPGAQIKYAAPTAKAVRKIIKPIFNKLLSDCPKELRPRWSTADQAYIYPNESMIHVAGTDQGNAENLRGTEADLAVVDEAGFIDELDYLIQDILLPQTLTCNGRILIASTPPKTPAHEYIQVYLEAFTRGASITKTIYDNPLITKATIEEYMQESGGEHSTTWQREYLCEFVTDSESQIIPEFTDAKRRQLIKEVERPSHFDTYVGMDVGFEDLTFIVFGYWDFKNDRLVIEDEAVLQGQEVRTDNIASIVANREQDLWGKAAYLKVSDNEPILLNDLSQLYNVSFAVTDKDEKDAQINNLRLLVVQNKLVIHPRCTSLIEHLKYGVWDKTRKKFARSKNYGHFDGIDALLYLARNVRRLKNPYPTQQHDINTEFFTSQPTKLGVTAQTFKDLFLRGTRGK